jgi:hypothetical protein
VKTRGNTPASASSTTANAQPATTDNQIMRAPAS